ncbi:MAG: hypothetical protein R2794_00015 [Chitinophagales bacterium]
MPKKKPMEGKPEVHKDLEGFEMNINEFGEISSNMDVDKLNKFLNKNVDDKKFRGLDEIPYAKAEDEEEDENFNPDDDLNEIADEFEEFRQFNDKDFKDEFDYDEKEHEYEDMDELEKDEKEDNDDDDDDFDDEEFLDEFADEFGEEDNYNFDENDFDN